MNAHARGRLATVASSTIRAVPRSSASWRLPVCALSALFAGCVTVHPNGLPDNKPDLPKAARINTQLGVDYAREGYYPLAEKKLKRAIQQQDDYAPAHAALAFVYSQTGAGELAEREYRRALALAPDDPDTQNSYGAFLCAHGKGEQAQNYFRRAIANPAYGTPAAAWTNAGVCARSMRRDADAEKDFRQALQADPQFAAALEQMAMLSVQKGDYRAARGYERHYRRVATPGPGMLLLSAQTERVLGDEARARSFETQLVQQYPDSPQAAQLGSQNP